MRLGSLTGACSLTATSPHTSLGVFMVSVTGSTASTQANAGSGFSAL
jgi:hypothetical protein